MDPADLARLKRRLDDERKELAVQLEDIGVSPETGAPSADAFEHGFADSGQATAEKARLLSVADALLTTLREVNAALRRVDAGSYGLCTDCGQQIPLERLEARPHARQCMRCKQRSA